MTATTQAAELLGRSRRWVADMCKIHRLRSVTYNPPYRIPQTEIDRVKKRGI